MILAAIAITAAVALEFSLRQERLYSASADILLSRQPLPSGVARGGNGGAAAAPRDANTQAALAHTRPVAGRAIVESGVRISANVFLAESSVGVNPDADILTFTVQDHNAGHAVQLVNGWSKAFTLYSGSVEAAGLQRALDRVTPTIGRLQRQVASDKRQDRKTSFLVQRELADLENTAQQIRAALALVTSNSFVVQSAQHATLTQPRTVRNVGIAAVLGALVGLVFAFMINVLDTRVRSEAGIETILALPLLGRLQSPGKGTGYKNLAALEQGGSVDELEAYFKVLVNLDFANLQRRSRIIMVTSGLEREGKSTTVANLAVAAALNGRRVALVDLDMRRPMIDRFFGLQGLPGMTEVAMGQVQLGEALVEVMAPTVNPAGQHIRGGNNGSVSGSEGRLVILSAGSVLPPSPAAFVGAPEVRRALGELRDNFDLVFIDAPPTLPLSDSMTIAAAADGVLVVVHARLARRPYLQELRTVLERAPAPSLGFVLTAASAPQGYRYGYGVGKRPDGHTSVQMVERSKPRIGERQ